MVAAVGVTGLPAGNAAAVAPAWPAAAPQLLAQLDGGGDQQRLDRVTRLGAGLDSGRARHPQAAQHLHHAIAGLGNHGGLAGLHGAGRGFGVDRVGPAASAAGLPVRPVDHDTTWPLAPRKRASAAP
jgi:hypothetical protein